MLACLCRREGAVSTGLFVPDGGDRGFRGCDFACCRVPGALRKLCSLSGDGGLNGAFRVMSGLGKTGLEFVDGGLLIEGEACAYMFGRTGLPGKLVVDLGAAFASAPSVSPLA